MRLSEAVSGVSIAQLEVYDVRFPTSLSLDGSDAVHVSPDYSCAYVILKLSNTQVEGHGFTFTCGRGTEIVVHAIQSYQHLVLGKDLTGIFTDFRSFWRSLANDSQLRWLGPDKGVVHLALAAIINALWDAWAKLEGKPLWRLLADMTPKELVSVIDFRHISDALSEEEAVQLLEKNAPSKSDRIEEIKKDGVPAYITSVGWMGYSDEKIKRLCREAITEGWTDFKMKVGLSLEDDKRRAKIIRDEIGYECRLMTDANQVWDVNEAVSWMKGMAEFKPTWIEEPTSPDDALGHATIRKELKPLGIGVATGEHCQNRVIFKQLFQSGGFDFCQIDACRVGGVNEVLAIILMAAKFGIPVCPHAGGVGLCELVQHLAMFNYVSVAPSFHNTLVEFADHLHDHFKDPINVKRGRYMAPSMPGYSAELKEESLQNHVYPQGAVWRDLIAQGKHTPV